MQERGKAKPLVTIVSEEVNCCYDGTPSIVSLFTFRLLANFTSPYFFWPTDLHFLRFDLLPTDGFQKIYCILQDERGCFPLAHSHCIFSSDTGNGILDLCTVNLKETVSISQWRCGIAKGAITDSSTMQMRMIIMFQQSMANTTLARTAQRSFAQILFIGRTEEQCIHFAKSVGRDSKIMKL